MSICPIIDGAVLPTRQNGKTLPCANLAVENEKLRELVRIMHGELVLCEDNGYVCGGHKFDERVRELGIGVDA